MGKIRIVSDGTVPGTRVLDSKGDPIDYVTHVVIQPLIGGDRGWVTAVITVASVELDVDAEATVKVDAG